MNKACSGGKVRNPLTGRCVNKDSPLLKIKPKNGPKLNNQKKVIMNLRISVKGVNFKAAPHGINNRKKIMEWYYKQVHSGTSATHAIKNILIFPGKEITDNYFTINVLFDYPITIDVPGNIFTQKDELTMLGEALGSSLDSDGNFPVMVKNNNIVSLSSPTNYSQNYNIGTPELVYIRVNNIATTMGINPMLGKPFSPMLPNPVPVTVPMLPAPVPVTVTVPVNPNKIIKKCGPEQYINPETKRCVLLKNPTIQKLLSRGYVLEDITIQPTQPQPIPQSIPQPQPIQLINCGYKKIINPQTGRCVKIDSIIGKKLTSVPYIIVNP